MGRELSIALSDGVLAAAGWHAAFKLWPVTMMGSVSFALLAIAATLGSVRFALAAPSQSLLFYHLHIAWLVGVLGQPLLANYFLRQLGLSTAANILLACGFGVVIVRRHLSEDVRQGANMVISGASLLTILALNVTGFTWNPLAVIGVICFLVAGLVIKTDGKVLGFKRVDLFHYVLAVSVVAFEIGLTKSPTPVYYNPK